jgi:hypothetical protein
VRAVRLLVVVTPVEVGEGPGPERSQTVMGAVVVDETTGAEDAIEERVVVGGVGAGLTSIEGMGATVMLDWSRGWSECIMLCSANTRWAIS